MKTATNGLTDEADLGLRFDVLTKTKQPELHRYWTSRDRAANVRLYRLATEILAAVDVGAFPPLVGWHCTDCPVRSRCSAWVVADPYLHSSNAFNRADLV
jgi:hypothetical protein